MLNLIFADVLSIMIELVNKNTLDIMGDNVTTTMAIAAIINNAERTKYIAQCRLRLIVQLF